MPQTRSRLDFLDHIRVFLTIMVIMLHTGITYGSNGGWFCTDIDKESISPTLQIIYQLFNTTTQAYSMGLFFLIAGYFTSASIKKKDSAQFLKDRFIRLGIPLALFALLIAPITIGLARLLTEGGTIADGFRWVWVSHNYECGPMWFVQTLLIFSVAYVVWKNIAPKENKHPEKKLPSHLTLLIAAIGTGIFAFSLRLWFNVGQNFYGMQLGYFASYIILFFAGCHAYKHRWLEKITFKYALPWAIAALILIITIPSLSKATDDGSLFTGGFNLFAFMYAMWEPFAAWGIILSLLYISRKFLPGTTPFVSGLARCSYAVYFIHSPVLVALTVLTHSWIAAPQVKWLAVGSMTCICSWAVAALIIRLPGLRRVF